MQRRHLVTAASALTVASLLATTSRVTPALAADKSHNGYGGGLKLEDVTGSASITIQKGKYYKEKHKDLKFYGDIVILKFIFFKGYVVVEGIIDGDIKNKWGKVVYEVKYERFKAKANLYKEVEEDEDDHPYPPKDHHYSGGWGKKHDDDDDKHHGPRPRPEPDEDDCDLFLDIGPIKIVKPYEHHSKDRYGKAVVIIVIDPDKKELDVKDRRLKDKLCEKAEEYEPDPDDDKHGDHYSF
jgi:hypothetical protein